jgi:hypothetical protein
MGMAALAGQAFAEAITDARYVGYPNNTPVPEIASTGVMWLLLGGLGLLCVGPFFLNAKRTHLD